MNSAAPAIRSAIPVLPVLDIDRTLAFYQDKLDFKTIANYADQGCAIVERDGVQLHFWKTDNDRLPPQSSCRVNVTGIETLYAECERQGIIHPNGRLSEKPWGLKEFVVLDPCGNGIFFQESISH